MQPQGWGGKGERKLHGRASCLPFPKGNGASASVARNVGVLAAETLWGRPHGSRGRWHAQVGGLLWGVLRVVGPSQELFE